TEGRVVDTGGVSGYAPPGPFKLGEFVGVGFTEPQHIESVPVPDGALAAVLLTHGELQMATTASLNRVLSALGAAYRYFPWPFWSDPRRRGVYSTEDAARTVLASMPRLNAPSAHATVYGDDVVLTLPQ